METISSLYQQQIDYNSNKSPYIKDFRKNPYSFLKARYYMLNATLVVYFLQNTSIHANSLTKAYICLGFLSAFLLAIPIDSLNYIALLIAQNYVDSLLHFCVALPKQKVHFAHFSWI